MYFHHSEEVALVFCTLRSDTQSYVVSGLNNIKSRLLFSTRAGSVTLRISFHWGSQIPSEQEIHETSINLQSRNAAHNLETVGGELGFPFMMSAG